MPERGFGVGVGFDQSGKKWDQHEFWHEARRLSGIPQQEGAQDLDWNKIANLISVFTSIDRGMLNAIVKRDITETGWLTAQMIETMQSLIETVGPHIPNQETIKKIKEGKQ